MILELRAEVVDKLNQQYRTTSFHTHMALKQIARCAE